MAEQWQTLMQLFTDLGKLVGALLQLALSWALLIAWIAWWLWGVNWKKTWSVLAQGAWMPVVLLVVAGALAWSQMAPSDCSWLGIITIPNFWWQLIAGSLLLGVTLFCGWLQGVFNWAPAEIDLEPPTSAASADGHGHH